MIVYAVVASRIYDQGILGIYATEADARARAEMVWPHTDGYHDLEIRPYELGVTYEDTFCWVNGPVGGTDLEARVTTEASAEAWERPRG